MKATIDQIQDALKETPYDGWLMYDFQRRNHLMIQFLEIDPQEHLTRRVIYWIPRYGVPVLLLSSVEAHALKMLPGERQTFASLEELNTHLDHLLTGVKSVCMEISPLGKNPYISLVDGGICQWIQSKGIEIDSSADVMQQFTCKLTQEELETHLYAAGVIEEALTLAWERVKKALTQDETITEKEVQQLIIDHFTMRDCVTEGAPIVAVGLNSRNPHYEIEGGGALITKDQLLLIDLWCKKNSRGAIFADVTHMFYTGKEVPKRFLEAFSSVYQAATAAIRSLESENGVRGCDVDLAARKVLVDAGFGAYLLHRTGHHLDTSDHGSGSHFDAIETEDTRRVNFLSCYAIEPALYKEDFGMRLECNVYVEGKGAVLVTTPRQNAITSL